MAGGAAPSTGGSPARARREGARRRAGSAARPHPDDTFPPDGPRSPGSSTRRESSGEPPGLPPPRPGTRRRRLRSWLLPSSAGQIAAEGVLAKARRRRPTEGPRVERELERDAVEQTENDGGRLGRGQPPEAP